MLTYTIDTTLQDSNGKFLVKTLESCFMKTGSNTINSLQSCIFSLAWSAPAGQLKYLVFKNEDKYEWIEFDYTNT